MEHLDDIFRQGLEELEAPCTPEAVARWTQLAELLHEWNRRINLTGYRDPEEIARRLLLEAAALAQQLPLSWSIADIGSGAGIPGIPIALCRPEAQVLLIEARERRHHFQRAALRGLRLSNVTPLHGRAEELAPRSCDGVVAQALAKPDRALATVRPWSRPGGWIALALGSEAPSPALSPDLLSAERLAYRAPGGGPERALWVARVRDRPAFPRS